MPTGECGPTTEDLFLGGRLAVRQPADGYRAGSDPVFLAAAIRARPGDSVLDLGCGVGTAGLCLLARLPQVSVTGLELQPQLADLARANIDANGFADRFTVVEGCLTDPPPPVEAGRFHHVMTNPPWYEPGTIHAPRAASKAIGHMEGEVDLRSWLKVAVKLVRPKGRLAVVHRADRLADILAALDTLPVGAVEVMPLWPRAAEAATRVIVTARKDARTPFRLLPGVMLHKPDGGYTDAAEAVLRHVAAL